MSFLANWNNQILLAKDVKKLLTILDSFCSANHNMDFSSTFFKYWFSYKNYAKFSKMCREQSTLIDETKERVECLAVQKRESWAKEYEHFFALYWSQSQGK